MRRIVTGSLTVLLGLSAAALVGCSEEGDYEKAGKEADKAVEDASKELEDAGKKVEEAGEELGKAVEGLGN